MMARSSQAACQSFLTVRRVPISAARRPTALELTRALLTQPRSRGQTGGRSTRHAWPIASSFSVDLRARLAGGPLSLGAMSDPMFSSTFSFEVRFVEMSAQLRAQRKHRVPHTSSR